MENPTETGAAPLVSIVIPAYNHACYLAETIESVLQQTYEHWELIIIDDGSSDDTPEIIQRYHDPRLRSFQQTNRGLSATLNRGISLARGKYFAFLPSDDVYEPNKLAVQVPVLEENPAVGVVFSQQTVIDAQGQPTPERHVQEWFEVPFTTKEEIFPALFERDFLSTPTHLLRMECFARVGRFDEALVTAQDYDLWLRILRCYDIRVLPQRLVRMRWHEHNQTRTATLQTEQERATVLLKAFRALSIEEIFPSLADIDRQTYPEPFARAYLTLARHVARNGLAELIPVARLYLTQALTYGWKLPLPTELQPLLETSTSLRRMSQRLEVALEEHADALPEALATGRAERSFVLSRSEKIHVVIEVGTLDKGGVEQVILSMATGLPRSLFRLLIVCVEQGGLTAEQCRRVGVPVEILKGEKKSAYQAILQRYRADLVVSHYSSFGLPIAAELGIPVISFVHGLYAWFREGILGEMGEWDQYISRYVAVSHDIADYLIRRFHIAPEKICVIPNGVEIVSTQQGVTRTDRAQWGLGPDDYVFLNVAAISPTKGHFALLQALRIVSAEHPNVKVLCVGQTLDEEYSQRVLEKRRQLQLEERLIFAGFQSDVTPFYHLADAFALPSVLEGFGLVKLEAMAHGLPLILTRSGDSDRLIENSDIGLMIPNTYEDLPSLDLPHVIAHLTNEMPGNVAHLAAAMTEFLVHPDYWRAAGQRGREKVLRAFTKERALKSYEAVFVREVWLARAQRSEEELRYKNNHLRTQVEFLERLVEEKTKVAQEKDRLLQERAVVATEKDRHLQEQEQRLAELLQSIGRQQEQIAALQHLSTQQFFDLQRLSLTIFDRLDLTKRTRMLRTRLLRGIWNRFPRGLKKPVKSVLAPIYRKRQARKDEAHSSRNTLADQLKVILAQHQFAREIILFAPSVHWKLPLFQRPHQLALAFARLGCLVFFCEPPYSEDYKEGFHSISQGLYVANAPIELFREIESPVVIVLSYNLCDLSGFRQVRCVYDYIDELTVFPGERKTLERNHKSLLDSATLVVATARRLWRQVVVSRPDAVLCPNGVDYAFIHNTMKEVLQTPTDLAQLLRPAAPVIGYYGALAEWFDYELVRYAATQRPGYEFVLIGPDYDGSLPKSKVLDEKNVHWLGVRPYSQLPGYLKYFDVATIPFKLNDITHSTSPVKLFEYMAAQKPVVTTAMDESARFEGVMIAKDATDFVLQLDAALKLKTDVSYRSLLDRLAQENTWDVRAQQLLDALAEKPSLQRSQTRTDPKNTTVHKERESSTAVQTELLALSPRVALPAPSLGFQQSRFLRMLGQHFGFQNVESIQDATKRMWVEFALSSNERGHSVVRDIKQYTKIRGKKCLDVGCAYGGFLAAFAAGGAKHVVGIDVNPQLLQLAAANLEDCHINAPLLQQDLLSPEVLELGQFDVITCNDVIEHVKDPVLALTHLAQLLEPRGLLYLEIPNKYYTEFLKSDGHYQLPGITLLPKSKAAQYHFLNFGDGYGVEFYRQLDYYLFHLKRLGLTPTVINPDLEPFNPAQLDSRFQEALHRLHSLSDKRISLTLALEIQNRGRKLYQIFQREVQCYQTLCPHDSQQARTAARQLHLRYGVDFWRIIARKEEKASA